MGRLSFVRIFILNRPNRHCMHLIQLSFLKRMAAGKTSFKNLIVFKIAFFKIFTGICICLFFTFKINSFTQYIYHEQWFYCMLRRLYYNFVSLKQRVRWYRCVCLSVHISCLMLTGPILEHEGKGAKFSKNGIKTHKRAWQEKNEGKLTKYSDMSCIFLLSHSKMVQIGPWLNLVFNFHSF